MSRLSASKMGLLYACQYPFRDTTEWHESRGRAAVQGDEFHHVIANYVDHRSPVVVPGKTKWLRDRVAHAVTWVNGNRSPLWRAEETYAYSPETGEGRILGYNLERKYKEAGLRDDEVAGSADIGWLTGDCAALADWKTGRFITDAAWDQMDALALFSARAHGAWRARATVLHVTDHGVEATVREYDDVSLWVVAEKIKAAVRAIEDSWPEAGAHCTAGYCPAQATCEVFQLNRTKGAA